MSEIEHYMALEAEVERLRNQRDRLLDVIDAYTHAQAPLTHVYDVAAEVRAEMEGRHGA